MNILIGILIGIAIGLAIAVVVAVIALVVWYLTRDVRSPNFELFEVAPDAVCFGDSCPIVIQFRVTNVGSDQQVKIGVDDRDIGVDPVGEIILLPNALTFPNGPGIVYFTIRVEAPFTGHRRVARGLRQSALIMADDAPRASAGFSVQIGDQPVGRLAGQVTFLGDTETDTGARTPESVTRFCKGSSLTALSMGTTSIRWTDFNLIPPDGQVSAAVTINQLNLYELTPGQVVNLASPLPIGDGIMIEATIPPPAGTVSQWPANSFVEWNIVLHIACP
jgi:hypothetical protein